MFKRHRATIVTSHAMALAFCCAGAGCSAAPADDASSESAVVGTNIQLEEGRIQATDRQCTTNAKTLQLRAGAAPAETVAKINDALRAYRERTLAEVDCTEPHTWNSAMTVVTNRGGVLSIAEAGVYGHSDAAMPQWFFLGHNYSMPSGEELRIARMLTSQGLAAAIRQCDETLAAALRKSSEGNGSEPPEWGAEGACADAMDPMTGPDAVTLERAGIHVYPTSLPAPYRNVASEGIVVPWDKLPNAQRTPLGARAIRALGAP